MRLIDADALKEKVEAIVFGCNLMGNEYQCRLSDTIDYISDVLIEGAPTIGGWIPCSERLPEEEGWYLVTIQNDKTEKRRTENDLFAIGIAEAHKLTPYKFCKDGHRQTVIAWMPLPEPWKGADDE